MAKSIRVQEAHYFSHLESVSLSKGFGSVYDYCRFLHENYSSYVPNIKPRKSTSATKLLFKTSHGRAHVGDSLAWLEKKRNSGKVDLIMTSPPFGLLRKKSYGNVSSEEYLSWFRPFAYGFKNVLKENGSLVIDVGGSWNSGIPSRSLYHFDLLIMLVRELGFHLCQEFYWWNPSKLPTPAEWVTIRRIRVKDAVNTVWWLSKTPFPKSSNTRILSPYSDSMHAVLSRGYHKAATRPSGHEISEKFILDNGGGIPPNLIALANTQFNRSYVDYCKRKGLPVHPARFPVGLPTFFIKFLTNRRDLVLDPFAGSLTTGFAAQRLDRRWVNIDQDIRYVKGGKVLFKKSELNVPEEEIASYRISGPNVKKSSLERQLSDWGGKSRR